MLRTTISISVAEALALAQAVSQAQKLITSNPAPVPQIQVGEQITLDMASGVAAQAKSQLWQVLKDLPPEHPIKQVHLLDEWMLDDSDMGGPKEMNFPTPGEELPPWIDPDHYFNISNEEES